MSPNATLGSFAEEHGTTDSLSRDSDTGTDGHPPQEKPDQNTQPSDLPLTPEGIEVELPLDSGVPDQYIQEDRHVPLSWIPEYWQEKQSDWNLLPKGSFSIIFDEKHCQHGWPIDSELQTGVYLRGKHGITPPTPVEVDDDLLAAAATTAAQAAHEIVSDYDLTNAPVVGLTKECATSLSVYLDSSVAPRQRVVYTNRSDTTTQLKPTTPGTDGCPPLFRGFTHIRLFNKGSKPHEIYTKAEQPRLSLPDIGWTQTLNNSL